MQISSSSNLSTTSPGHQYSSYSCCYSSPTGPVMPRGRLRVAKNQRPPPLLSLTHNARSVFKVLSFQKKDDDIPIIEERCIDDIYNVLAERLVPTATAALASSNPNPNAKILVGLAGPPGAGKSTLAKEVAKRVNTLCAPKANEVATVLPMDGFHLYRHQLDAMENPKEAHARRGAPWTFDPARLLTRLKTLREEGSVYVPSFDHGVGDPVEDDILVTMQHKVVLVEGNYLLLQEGVWNEISSMFDEKWFIHIDIDTSMRRVLRRHISTGKAPDVAKWRIGYNDRPNAELVLKSKKNADLVINSIDL